MASSALDDVSGYENEEFDVVDKHVLLLETPEMSKLEVEKSIIELIGVAKRRNINSKFRLNYETKSNRSEPLERKGDFVPYDNQREHIGRCHVYFTNSKIKMALLGLTFDGLPLEREIDDPKWKPKEKKNNAPKGKTKEKRAWKDVASNPSKSCEKPPRASPREDSGKALDWGDFGANTIGSWADEIEGCELTLAKQPETEEREKTPKITIREKPYLPDLLNPRNGTKIEVDDWNLILYPDYVDRKDVYKLAAFVPNEVSKQNIAEIFSIYSSSHDYPKIFFKFKKGFAPANPREGGNRRGNDISGAPPMKRVFITFKTVEDACAAKVMSLFTVMSLKNGEKIVVKFDHPNHEYQKPRQ